MLYSLIITFQLFFFGMQENQENREDTGTIKVKVGEFKNTEGYLLVSLFNSKQYFPDNEDKAFQNKKIKVTAKTHEVIFEKIPFGEYAVIFLHDENDNEEMDTNFVGAPQEGYGASNDAVNTFSAPKYDEAKFILNSSSKEIKLKIFY